MTRATLIALLVLARLAPAAPLVLENTLLSVQVGGGGNPSGFAITPKSAGSQGVANGVLMPGEEAVGSPVAGKAVDSRFGQGTRATVTFKSGAKADIEVFPALPFALIRPHVANESGAEMDIASKVVASWEYSGVKPAGQLRVMGTGGLAAPDKNPGSYLFLACADPESRTGQVSGWATQQRGSGIVFSGIKDKVVTHKAELQFGHLILAPGQSAALDTFAIGLFPDARIGLEDFASIVARMHDIKLRPKQAVYCTWYAEGKGHGQAGTAATTVELSKFIKEQNLKEFGLEVIQIDDRWQDGPNIQGPATEFSRVKPDGPYKDGIKPVATQVKSDGLDFGIWWLPFGRNHMQPEFKDKQDWFVKKSDGTPLRQQSFGGTCLDSTHPEVQAHLKSLARTMKDWNVDYFKMDGLSVGAGVDHVYINDGYKDDKLSACKPLHDRSKTNIEALRMGLKMIREGAGDKVFFSGCCAVQNMRIYAGTIGLVDSMRIGPDFNHDGQGIRSGPLRGSWVYFLNGKVWWNDPDPTKVRASNASSEGDSSMNGAVTVEQARMTSSWVSLTNQFYLISDWLPDLPAERLDILKRTMAAHHATTRPVDYFDNNLANTWMVSDTKNGMDRHVLGLFNFYPTPLEVNHGAAKLGLDPAVTYHAYDYWADTLLPDVKGGVKETVAPMACRVIALRPVRNHPSVISTSRHVTQGMVDVVSEKWANNTLVVISKVIANDPYELRVRVPDGWAFDKAEGSIAQEATPGIMAVKVLATAGPGLVRVKLSPPASGEVAWAVKFKPVPKPKGVKVGELSAVQGMADDPVVLTWQGSTPFYQISRDGVVIADGHYGMRFEDAGAPAGKPVSYTVTAVGGPDTAKASAAVGITTKAMDPGPVPPLPQINLGTLTPLKVEVGYGALAVNKSAVSGPLLLSGKTYASGIGVHANAKVSYAKPAGAKSFVAVVGLNDKQRADPRASIRCSVVAEDAAGKATVIARTPVLSSGKIEQWHVNAAIPAAATRIQLVVDDNGDGINCDHADWADAGFRE